MNYVSLFFTGAFLCNCIPHLAAGLMGNPFPTPFAKPSGVGLSSPLINVLWGGFNFLAGLGLLSLQEVGIGLNGDFLTLIAGALVMGVFSAYHFGKVRHAP